MSKRIFPVRAGELVGVKVKEDHFNEILSILFDHKIKCKCRWIASEKRYEFVFPYNRYTAPIMGEAFYKV